MRAIAKYSATALVITAVASSYWLVPFIAGDSAATQAVRNFGAGDRQAYATSGTGLAGGVGNVIRLQGFWAETKNLYLLPKDYMPVWGLITIGVWVLVWAGGRSMLRPHPKTSLQPQPILAARSGSFLRQRNYGYASSGELPERAHQDGFRLTDGGFGVGSRKRKRFEVFILGGSGFLAVLVATMGIGSWFTEIIPALSGFREPQKFVGLVALAFAYFAAQGIPALAQWFKTKGGETVASMALCIMLILPVLWTPTMFWGFAGQLSPRSYPADWFMVNDQLNQDTDDFKVLFLPWHLYMHFRFAGRNIVNPADDFFDKQIIVSNDPEFQGSSLADHDPLKQKLSRDILPNAAINPELGKVLAAENIKYLLLAKESDAADYDYLQNRPDLELAHESTTLRLYRNKAWRGRHAQ